MQHTRVAALVAVVWSISGCSFDPNGATAGGANDAATLDVYAPDDGVPPPPPPDARVDATPAPDAAIDASVVTPDAAGADASTAPDANAAPDAATLPDASMPLSCPSGYQHGQHQNADHCYRFVLTARSWVNAEADCENDNTSGSNPPKPHLIVFSNEAEYADVASALPNQQIWIGANDIASEGNFVNVTGGTFISTHFNPGEPNNSGPMGAPEDCLVYVTANRGLNDLGCDTTHPYLCELDGDSP